MSIQRSSCFFNLWSSCSSRPKQRWSCRGGLTAPYYSHHWPGPAATATSHRSQTSEPSYSSTCGHPLPRLPRLHVVPFLASSSSTALVLSARHGQHGPGMTSIGRVLYVERLTAGSTAATRKCLLITRKIMIPPLDNKDPPDGPPYFVKKHSPLTTGTHQLHLRTQESASEKK